MLLLDDTSPTALAVDTRLPPSAPKVAALMTRAWPRLAGRVTLETRVIEARARVVVLPCCQEKATCDAGGVDGWMDAALAIDVTRAARLRAAGFVVHTQTIPATITPKNRLLLAEPA